MTRQRIPPTHRGRVLAATTGTEWSFSIPLPPMGKQRPRFGKGRVYTPRQTRDFQYAVAWSAKSANLPKFQEPLELTVAAFFTCRTAGEAGSPAPDRVDGDNIAKLVADGLCDHFNDRYVTDWIIRKRYVAPGESARVEVTIRTITPKPSETGR